MLRSPIRASLLRAISESLTREPCLEHALEDVLERCLDATSSRFAAVYLADSSGDTPVRVMVDRTGRAEGFWEQQGALDPKALARSIPPSEVPPPPEGSLHGGPGTTRAVVAAIGDVHHRAGVLWLECAHAELDFDEWQALANTVATQIAQALARRRTESELGERARLATLFADVSIAPTEFGAPPPDMGMMGGPPPGPPPGPQDAMASATAEDWLRVAIEAAKNAADADETDDIETADVMKAIQVLQGLLSGRQKEQEALMGGGPATKALSRAYGG